MMEWWNAMEYRQPLWLWGLLLPWIVLAVQGWSRSRQYERYADRALWPWVLAGVKYSKKSYWKRLWRWTPARWLGIAWLAFMVALAGPRTLESESQMGSQTGVDVVLSLDLSRSMLAEDVTPNRLQFAKTIAESVVQRLSPTDRIGLHVFAGKPHTLLPLTTDKQVVLKNLAAVDTVLLPTQGSWLELALRHDLERLSQMGGASKVLVVFTDGAPPFWKEVKPPVLSSNQQSLAELGQAVKVVYVGVGTSRSTVIPDANHKSGRLHVNGLLVQSRLESSQLKQLAERVQGIYLQADSSPAFLNTLLDIIRSQASTLATKDRRAVWKDHASPLIALSIFSLWMAFYGMSFWASLWSAASRKSVASTSQQAWMIGLVLGFVSLGNSMELHANTTDADTLQQAYSTFQEKEFELAESLYDGVNDYAGWFGAGASAYRRGDLEVAVIYFRQAAWQAPDDTTRAAALFNLGNTYVMANLLAQAIESYQQALLYRSPYAKAEHNLALAQTRWLTEVEVKQEKAKKEGESSGRDDGAFYGGQKPSGDPQGGMGSDGDMDTGRKQDEDVALPQDTDYTEYALNPSIAALQRLHSRGLQTAQTASSKVLEQQQRLQRAERFEQALQGVKDDQPALIKHLFEREEGFQARQNKVHEIPGVQPW